MFDTTTDYHSVFQLADLKHKLVLTEVGEIHTLELTKLPKRISQILGTKEQWLYFLKKGNTMEQKLINDWNSPEIQKAYKELERLSLDPKFRAEYEYEYKRLTDRSWREASAFKKGQDKEKALSKEREKQTQADFAEREKQAQADFEAQKKKAQIRIATSLANEGIEQKKITLIMGISMEELQNLLSSETA